MDDLLKLKQIEEMVEVYYNTGQFVRTLELLVNAFETLSRDPYSDHGGGAFGLFTALGEFYEAHGLDMVNLSRNSRYENLLEFGQEYVEIVELRQAMILDYYSRENIKTRPEFLGEETVSKEFAKEFYSTESRDHRYLTGSELIGCEDPRTLRKHTHLEKITDGYLLFDYTRRDPITNNAIIIKL